MSLYPILNIFRKVLHPEPIRDIRTMYINNSKGKKMQKEDLELRLKELEQNIVTQQQQVQQIMANVNAMLGAKEEVMIWLKKITEAE